LNHKTAQILAISSGKGGVGKTTLAVNIGISLSKMGHRVCLFDADTNLANINIMLKVMPEWTLENVLRGEKDIHDIVIKKSGISLVPSASGVTDFSNLELTEQHRLIQVIGVLEKEYDYLLVDTSAGIHNHVLSFIESAHQCMLVITPEPTSLTDAFSLVRVLTKRDYKKRINVVVNSTISELAARKTYKRFSMAVAKYIGCKVGYLGFIIKDDQLAEAICAQSPVVISQPSALSSRCFNRISQTISKMTQREPDGKGLSVFWKKELASKMPDFYSPQNTASARHQYITASQLTKRQLIVDHKYSILDFIDDPDMSREEVEDTMKSFVSAYVNRFNAYPVDVIKALNHSLELNKIPQKDLDKLLTSLQLFYKNDSTCTDKYSSAQYLCQLVNAHVEQHKSFPFDPIYALYQAFDIDDINTEQVSHLLITLNLIYQSKNKHSQHFRNLAQQMIYCAERNNSQLKELTELLQRKYITGLEETQQPEEKLDNMDASKGHKSAASAFLDSIRYASLIE
jgi:flagellar biosynthesis protein FlhG